MDTASFCLLARLHRNYWIKFDEAKTEDKLGS